MQGRKVLVVGGGQSPSPDGQALTGNGRAICLTLARRGARVACADRDLAAAQATAAAGPAQSILALEGDVADAGDVTRMVQQAHARLDGLDGLVLNVGISRREALGALSPASWDAIHAVNLRGHMLVVQAALPLLAPGAAVVFISSVAARMPQGRNPAYETAKAGLSALCRATAYEARERDIRANTVLAGLIDTPMGRAATAARPGRAGGPLPLGRQGSAWDVAHAVAFLLSDDAAYINATELVVDGGLSAGVVREV
ncbi:SDR family oxidoreductase [Verticiella sediminum]|uniref:SDR family oxidoreductase n=1 Tax=Verticiella sediminum TaxID=1247510 RepID=A0A556AFS3_9BURK|nr:SDR family NAD(P)-dependent oxidoreductase [Verticiella sediminum]TSH91731.1 SDR family oxidoreductase [Verticiella sediminum]